MIYAPTSYSAAPSSSALSTTSSASSLQSAAKYAAAPTPTAVLVISAADGRLATIPALVQTRFDGQPTTVPAVLSSIPEGGAVYVPLTPSPTIPDIPATIASFDQQGQLTQLPAVVLTPAYGNGFATTALATLSIAPDGQLTYVQQAPAPSPTLGTGGGVFTSPQSYTAEAGNGNDDSPPSPDGAGRGGATSSVTGVAGISSPTLPAATLSATPSPSTSTGVLNEGDQSNQLSNGQIAGIVVGVTSLFILLLAAIALWLCGRRRRRPLRLGSNNDSWSMIAEHDPDALPEMTEFGAQPRYTDEENAYQPSPNDALASTSSRGSLPPGAVNPRDSHSTAQSLGEVELVNSSAISLCTLTFSNSEQALFYTLPGPKAVREVHSSGLSRISSAGDIDDAAEYVVDSIDTTFTAQQSTSTAPTTLASTFRLKPGSSTFANAVARMMRPPSSILSEEEADASDPFLDDSRKPASPAQADDTRRVSSGSATSNAMAGLGLTSLLSGTWVSKGNRRISIDDPKTCVLD